MEKINKTGFTLGKTKKDLLFCLLLLIIPTLQFVVFYILVNCNSFLLSFQYVDKSTDTLIVKTSFVYFQQNWEKLKTDFFCSGFFGNYLGNSILYWAIGVFVGTPLALLFSYYISKKFFGSSFFRIILYLPSIISGFILVIFYKGFVEWPLRNQLGLDTIMGSTGDIVLQTLLIIFFNVWISFGTTVLLYSNSMSAISPEILESCSIDGAKGFKEFIHIVFPSVFSTFSVFFVTSLAQIFINQANLYSFFFRACPDKMATIGYFMFKYVSQSPNNYGEMSLLGIIFSIIIIPVTFIVRKLLEKYGPSEK